MDRGLCSVQAHLRMEAIKVTYEALIIQTALLALSSIITVVSDGLLISLRVPPPD